MLFEDGCRLVEADKPNKGARKLRRAAQLGHVAAQGVLGRLLLEEFEADEVVTQEREVLQSMLPPQTDELGRPTGGAKDAQAIKRDLKRQRKQNAQRARGDRPRDKRAEGLALLMEASRKGDAASAVALANAWFADEATQQALAAKGLSTSAAIELYWSAARQDPPHPDALFNLAMMYYDGVDGELPRDGKRTLALMHIAADECEDPSARFYLGQYYVFGDEKVDADFEGDEPKGWAYVQLACEQGHPGARMYAVRFLLNQASEAAESTGASAGASAEGQAEGPAAEGPAAEGFRLAAKDYLEQALAQEDGDALYMAGSMHRQSAAQGSLFGNPTPDLPKALRYFERAGVAGNADGFVAAGAMLYKGEGAAQDMEAAYRAYERAAGMGSLEAFKNISSMLYFGDGPLDQDRETAQEIAAAIKTIEDARDEAGLTAEELKEELQD